MSTPSNCSAAIESGINWLMRDQLKMVGELEQNKLIYKKIVLYAALHYHGGEYFSYTCAFQLSVYWTR